MVGKQHNHENNEFISHVIMGDDLIQSVQINIPTCPHKPVSADCPKYTTDN